nr:MAG TPA: hypothetical protein [Caudoviricetes sp.]
MEVIFRFFFSIVILATFDLKRYFCLQLFQHCFNITKIIYYGNNIQNRGVLFQKEARWDI